MRRDTGICLALAALTLAAYWPVGRCEFINFDDPVYLINNKAVQSGLTVESVRWAFTTTKMGSWHPITWLTHILGCQFFGLNAGAHHCVNLGFHVANTLLLFLVLKRMTAATWRSAMVAALFACHPLHVESVAWVSERKDVVSGFFALLTLWAYARYAQERCVSGPKSKVFYGSALVLFLFGLMSKPMLVTLPVILLLLDFWPLGRALVADSSRRSRKSAPTIDSRMLGRLIYEKLPFFGLSAAVSVATFLGQRGSGYVLSFEQLPLEQRICNAIVSYAAYMGKMVWPANLAVIYPYVDLPLETTLVAGLLLAFFSVISIRQLRSRPFLFVGWFWFVVTLLPVIGLVQVGAQPMADRYTYLPMTGLYIAVVWSAVAAMPATRPSKIGAVVGAVAVLAACLMVTRSYLKFWQNSISLFTRALQVSGQNAVASNNLGDALDQAGDKDTAIACFREALKNPNYPAAHNNLGMALAAQGKYEEAEEHYRAAIRLQPSDAPTHYNLGSVLVLQGRYGEAETALRTALQIRPDYELARQRLGGALALLGKHEEAEGIFIEALRHDPTNASLHRGLGNVLSALGRNAEAFSEYSLALQSNPDDATTHEAMAMLLLKEGRTGEAWTHLEKALSLQPTVGAHALAASIQSQQGNAQGAIHHYREALRLKPESPAILNDLAWVLATSPDATLRDGAQAVALAERACELSQFKQTIMLGTLGAAYAEAGRFAEAMATARKACTLAAASGQEVLLRKNQELLDLYCAGRPFHEVSPTNQAVSPTLAPKSGEGGRLP